MTNTDRKSDECFVFLKFDIFFQSITYWQIIELKTCR